MTEDHKHILKAIIVGSASYILCFTIGRYIFTPMLAWMQHSEYFSDTFAGILSSSNFIGYLLGSLFLKFKLNNQITKKLYVSSIIMIILFTISTGIFNNHYWWTFARFMTGFTGAIVFLISFSNVVSVISYYNKGYLSIYLYAGIGITIALCSKGISILVNHISWEYGWVIAGIFGIPFGLLSLYKIGTDKHDTITYKENPPEHNYFIKYIIASYFCMGFANNISATFIVTILQRTSENFSAWNSWLVVGLSAAIAPFIFSNVVRKFGYAATILILNPILSIGILLPAVLNNNTAVYIGSILFGMTFLTIPPLILTYGAILSGKNKNEILAKMTLYFGVSLIIGPIFAGYLSDLSSSFVPSAATGSFVAFLGAVIFFYGHKKHNIKTLKM